MLIPIYFQPPKKYWFPALKPLDTMLIFWWQYFSWQSQTLHAVHSINLSSETGLATNSTSGAASYVLWQQVASNQTLEKGGKEELPKEKTK